MKQGTTLFLKIAVMIIGAPVLVLALFALPWLVNNPVNPAYANILYPIVGAMYVSVIPFFVALYQALKLLSYIDRNQAFSKLSVTSLKVIKRSAITISGLYVVAMPFIFRLADLDDAPGIIVIGMVLIFAAMVIAVFAAVLQRLLQEAIDIKSENDLVV
ncbi:DUF2975 domain-containing protein [Halalkalibacter krulwichiae]|uniref:DUF2975 domain-containing protein n=1 Tax=Halalkalibacter krulwichiae TaxID=199441 RepID=A0A1X9MLB3_9BACI|nr:DUF2975 domain-containing protein [Halalkalibacter krulwichiae]ARK32611.1 hypothetical protein BkAM31D_23570 [Halalkalibacter krulwichiae]